MAGPMFVKDVDALKDNNVLIQEKMDVDTHNEYKLLHYSQLKKIVEETCICKKCYKINMNKQMNNFLYR